MVDLEISYSSIISSLLVADEEYIQGFRMEERNIYVLFSSRRIFIVQKKVNTFESKFIVDEFTCFCHNQIQGLNAKLSDGMSEKSDLNLRYCDGHIIRFQFSAYYNLNPIYQAISKQM